MKKLFSIILLLSFGIQAEEALETSTHEVAFAGDITAFAKEIPGKVYIHKATRGALKFDLAKENGYDAVILEKDETTLDWAKEAGFHVETITKFTQDGKTYAIVLFDTDKKDDIIDWLAA
ncbi:hypothetical protein K9K77_00275 [Candidatus Babeliales bacterium]|nr:hypothetical protein [Candidatus Babeliales bacterium]